jgi:hypothetical protein
MEDHTENFMVMEERLRTMVEELRPSQDDRNEPGFKELRVKAGFVRAQAFSKAKRPKPE